MNSKLVLIAAGALCIISVFLPWVSFMGITANGLSDGSKIGFFFIALGMLIAVMGFLQKKWSAIVAIVLSACVAGLGAKYFNDVSSPEISAGFGLYAMLAGGIIGIAGGIMGLMAKRTPAII